MRFMLEREKILICLLAVIIAAGSFGVYLFVTRNKLPCAIRIASGPKGGEYYPFGKKLEEKLNSKFKSKIPRITAENRETAGTMENLRLLKEGEVERQNEINVSGAAACHDGHP